MDNDLNEWNMRSSHNSVIDGSFILKPREIGVMNNLDKRVGENDSKLN